jgi:hypothetical protein
MVDTDPLDLDADDLVAQPAAFRFPGKTLGRQLLRRLERSGRPIS